MRRVLLATLAIAVLGALGATGYHFASPKVELRNLSQQTVDEFRLQLPSSRLTIGPIAPGAFERMYFSLQSKDGDADYSLWSGGEQIASGSLPYGAKGQLFRRIAVVIHPDGSVAIAEQ